MSFALSIPQLEKVTEQFVKAPVLLEAARLEGLTKAAIAIQAIIKNNAPVKSGALRNSVTYRVDVGKAIIGPKVNYAKYVAGGTGLWGKNNAMIVPKNAKVLATKINPGWGSKNAAGYFIIGKHSKGQKPNPFMQKSAKQAIPIIIAIFKEANLAAFRNLDK